MALGQRDRRGGVKLDPEFAVAVYHATPVRQILRVATGIASVLVLAAPFLSLDGRVVRSLGAIAFALVACLSLAERKDKEVLRRRALAALFAVATALAVLTAWSVTANWPLDAGRAAHDASESEVACRDFETALDRMDSPGVVLPGGRFKLTAYGPVHISRVTTMIELAEIAATERRWSDALSWLDRAEVAARSDSGEHADLAFIEEMRVRVEDLAR